MKTLLRNVHVVTMDTECPGASSILIDGERILALDPANPVYDREIDLSGRCVLPGLIDTHTHFFQVAKQSIDLDLVSARSLDDVADLIREYLARTNPLPPWIGGCGWDRNLFPSTEGFDRTFLDRFIPDVPVILKNKDLHTKWVNTKALEMVGINADTPDPPGGAIGRDGNGVPDGFIYERAWKLFKKIMVLPPVETQRRLIREAVSNCHTLGLTGVHLMESEADHRLYPELQDEGMRFRVYWHFSQSQLDEMITAGVRSYTGTDSFVTCGMKLFMDGSIGSQTAYMFDPYPGTTRYGTLAMPVEQLEELVRKAAANGLACSIHAIGDRCVHEVIDVLDRVNREVSWQPHRIEHLQCILKDDVAKLTENHIRCAVQPVHIKADVELVMKYWPNLQKETYCFCTLREAGVLLGFGSDAPVETINPFEGIYSAMERRYRNDPNNPSWTPDQRLTFHEALAGYTIDAARIANVDDKLGSLIPGKLADLIVIEDFRDKPAEFWLTARSHLTMIGGEIVYREE
jgi:predicted amidohydrolase YtcJ